MTALEMRQRRIHRLNCASRMISALGVVLMMTAVMAVTAFADSGASGQISSAVNNGMKQAYDLITSIIMPIGAVCFAIAAAKLMFAGRRAMEEGQTKLLVIFLVIAAVYLAPIIIQEISGWFSDVSTSSSIWGSPRA